MADDDDNDDEPLPVRLRPYSAECEGLAGWQNWQEGSTPLGIESTPEKTSSSATASRPPTGKPRTFQPTPPSQRRHVERVSFSSTSIGLTPESMLTDAWRHQQLNEDPSRGVRKRFKDEKYAGMSLSKFGLTNFGSGINDPQSSAASSSGVPRKLKERKEGKSLELMDLAFVGEKKLVNGEIVSNYAPISLPYFHVTEEEDSTQDASAAKQKKSRPAMMHVDEMNANAAQALFLNSDGNLQEDQIFLMQLPSVLPELLDPQDEVQREQEDDNNSVGQGATLTRLPDGLLGKLRIHKSGKVKMVIGDLEFCVDQGCDTFFQQDLACVCPTEREIFALGQIHKRMVLTPDIDALTADLSEVALGGSSSSDVAGAEGIATTIDASAASQEIMQVDITAAPAGPAQSFGPDMPVGTSTPAKALGVPLRQPMQHPRSGGPGRPHGLASSGARSRGRS